MKFIKKFADWKTWVFIVLPILLFVAWLAILIYAVKNSITDPALIIGAQMLFTIAMLLLLSTDVFKQLKKKTVIPLIATVALIACFVGLQVATMVLFPHFCDLDNKENSLHETLIEMTIDDPEYEQTHDAWFKTVKDLNDLSFTMEMLSSASFIAIAFVRICSKSTKKEEPELSEQNANNNDDNNGDDGGQQAQV